MGRAYGDYSMKHHLIACRDAALRAGFTRYAEAIAALYLQEYGKPMPSPAASAVAEYLHPHPALPALVTHDHPTH